MCISWKNIVWPNVMYNLNFGCCTVVVRFYYWFDQFFLNLVTKVSLSLFKETEAVFELLENRCLGVLPRWPPSDLTCVKGILGTRWTQTQVKKFVKCACVNWLCFYKLDLPHVVNSELWTLNFCIILVFFHIQTRHVMVPRYAVIYRCCKVLICNNDAVTIFQTKTYICNYRT